MPGIHPHVHRYLAVTALVAALAGCGGGGGNGDSASVSGIITIESGTRVDADTADDAVYGTDGSNDAPLPVPVILAGYLSADQGYYDVEKTLEYVVDMQDSYAVPNLEPGDQLVMQYFTSENGNPPGQVCLTVGDGSPACGTNGVLTQQAQSDEKSIVVSVTAGGPLRYVLEIDPGGQSQGANLTYQEPELMANEALVRMDPVAVGMGAARLQARIPDVAAVRELRPGLMHLRRQASARTAAVTSDQRRETLAWIRGLQRRADITLAEPNYIYRTQSQSPGTNPLYSRQSNLGQISVPLAWQLAPTTGTGVGVAVMDTGLFSATPGSFGNWHPDLEAGVIGATGVWLDFVSGDLDQDAEPGPDTNPANPGNQLPQPTSFHGTHVAGIITAVDNSQGMIGVAHGATLIPYRVLGVDQETQRDGVGTLSDLVAALDAAAKRDDVDVINLSLGGLGPSSALEDVVNQAADNGQLVVAAAGNEGVAGASYPARFASVVGVGAVNVLGERAFYSNFGAGVDVYAPGGDSQVGELIISAWGQEDDGNFTSGFAGLQGTSMAAPHVSGVYALMLAAAREAGTELTGAGFRTLLAGGDLTDASPACAAPCGLINAARAVNAAVSAATPGVLAADPALAALASPADTATLTLTTVGSTTNANVAGAVTLPQGIAVTPDLVTGEPVPESIVVSATDELATLEEDFRATLTIPYGDDNAELDIPVLVKAPDERLQRDAGRHYVLLVDADTGETVEQAVVRASGGAYRFTIEPVPAGDYFLVAGTDLDNNLFICESGEACAEYPVNGLPQTIAVGNQDIEGLTFNTRYQRPTITEMGLPRYGFEGYRRSDGNDDPARRALKEIR